MNGVPRSAVLGVSNPILDLYTVVGGLLVTPISVSFAIFDVSDDTKLLAPVQVVAPTSLDLEDDAVSLGRYAAPWTVSGSETLGRHEIRWTVVPSAGAAAVVVRREFDVLVGVLGGGFSAYALPSDLAEEGVGAEATMARIQRVLKRATQRIELITGRFFEPRMLTIKLDGTQNKALRFDAPIIAIQSITYENGTTPVDATNLRVYNRHLSQGLTSPDDRNDPRVEWTGWERPFIWRFVKPPTAVWSEGRQNVVVTGLFGYTDPDGSFTGGMPDRLREAAKMIAMRDLPGLASDPEDRLEGRTRHRITSETTRDQSYTMSADGRLAEFTGDPEIDQILCDYIKPPFIGST